MLFLYAPVLTMGPVAEDFQWAYKGWSTLRHPASFLQPFHQHLRPAGRLFFLISANLFGDRWYLYRLVTLASMACLALLAYHVLRKTVKLRPGLAAAGILVWLASPFSDEVLFVTNQVKQILFATGILLVLQARRSQSRMAPALLVAGTALAFGSKEEAAVLPALLLLQDLLLFRLPFRHAARHLIPWVTISLLYLALYNMLVHFEARWFYSEPLTALPHLATTWMAFWHLHPPVLGQFTMVLRKTWPLVLGALVLTAVATVPAWRKDDRTAAFGFLAAIVLLSPTLPANIHTSRYTFLPFLFFLSGVLAGVRTLARWHLPRLATLALGLTLLTVMANDSIIVRGDRMDWDRYATLTARLRRESRPVISALRDGSHVAAIRGRDGSALKELLHHPRGVPKIYFPRPDDPYGVTSLSALVSWELRHEGIAAPRLVEPIAIPAVVYLVHDTGGFRKVPPLPGALSRPFGAGVVILHPVPGDSFNPDVFP